MRIGAKSVTIMVSMLSVAHGVAGAYVATKVPNPFLAVIIILGLHYLGDWLPHWDVGTGLSNGKRKKGAAFWLELLDLGLTLGLVILFWQVGEKEIAWPAYWGALVGILPDLINAPKTFLKWEPRFMKPLSDFHQAFHHSTPHKLFGLLPQVLLLILIYFLR